MVFDITNLKKIRKQLNLTQFQLAKKANVSQSLIAKIESNRLDPTYSKVKLLENALNSLTKMHQKEAKDIMIKYIISVNPETKLTKAIELMRKHNISQLPVLKNEVIIGLVSETSILSKNLTDIKDLKSEEVMNEAPPIISKDTKIDVIKDLLKYYPIVLIKEKGKLIGLITKADLIRNLV